MRIPFIIIFALVGAVAAGTLAVRNESRAAQTHRTYFASIVRPADTLPSPRTFNQTLVESIDSEALVATLQSEVSPAVVSLRFDVLADSFHIQTTVGLTEAVAESTGAKLTAQLGAALSRAATELTTALLGTGYSGVVIPTKTLPQTAAIEQNPFLASGYGAVAGGLFGLFLSLALAADTKKKV